MKCNLLDLPWDDVIFSNIFSYLSLRDVFNFRLASYQCQELVNCYFASLKRLILEFGLSTKEMMVLAESTSRLLKIEGEMCVASNEFIECLIKNNNSLTHVDLSNTNLLERSLHGLIFCKNMRQVQFRRCSWLTNDLLAVLFHHLKYIEYIDATDCLQLQPDSVCEMLFQLPSFKYGIISTGQKRIIYSPANPVTISAKGWLVSNSQD